jgi:hypothetical protein
MTHLTYYGYRTTLCGIVDAERRTTFRQDVDCQDCLTAFREARSPI